MIERKPTKAIQVGNLILGDEHPIAIQSMCSIKTSRVEDVISQIRRCESLGADLMRLSVLDFEDAAAFSSIKEGVRIPLIADIHFDYRLALSAIEHGADAIRLNPGNIGGIDHCKEVARACQSKNIPIRIGANSGSLPKDVRDSKQPLAEKLCVALEHSVSIFENIGFQNLVLSAKGSDVLQTIEAYRLVSKRFNYPLHIGITEAGPKDVGLIRSTAGLAPLLLEGIGDTIRISLTDDPEEEIKACRRLLKDLGLRNDYPAFISCPTCGRTQVNLIPTAKKIQKYVEENCIAKSIAVMGCVVNGPGEAKNADLGCAGGNGVWVIFRKGKVIAEVPDSNIVNAMIEEIQKL